MSRKIVPVATSRKPGKRLKNPPPLPEGAMPIPDAPGYAALPNGQIITCRGQEVNFCYWREWRQMKRVYLQKKKYPYNNIKRGGKRVLVAVHRLVLLAFKGEPPEGSQGCHNDGDAENASIDNLRWDTIEANTADKFRHGTVARGSQINTSKLTEEEVIKIRHLHAGGMTAHEIGRRFGVATGTVCFIVKRKTWKHLKDTSGKSRYSGELFP